MVLKLFDAAAVDEILVEVAEFVGDAEVVDGGEFFVSVFLKRVDVELDVVFEEAAKGLQDAAFELGVVFFVEEFAERADAHADADHFGGVAGDVGGEAVVLEVVGDEDGHSRGDEHVGAGKKVGVVDFTSISHQVLHGDFHDLEGGVGVDIGFLTEAFMGATHDVDVGVADRAEGAALDEDGFLAEDFGGLENFALGPEHGGRGEAHLNEFQGHQAVVDVAEFDAREFDHVDFDTFGGEVIEKGFEEFVGVVMKHAGAVDEVDSDNPKSVLLESIGVVEHAHVDDDLAAFVAGVSLEADTQPAMTLVRAVIIPGGNGVGEGEKSGGVAAISFQAFEVQVLLIFEHGLETILANVALTFAVDGIADLHVVGRDAFGNRAGSSPGLEEPADDFLAGSDFCEGAVAFGVEVDLQGFVESGQGFWCGHFSKGPAGSVLGRIREIQLTGFLKFTHFA